MRRVSWASTRSVSSARVWPTAFRIASFVISLKTIRFTGTFGLSSSIRCQPIDSPSRSSSVAISSSLAPFMASLSSVTRFFLSAETM